MPLTAAERQKRYREKLKTTNPEKFEKQKKKNNERTLQQYRRKVESYSEEKKEELRRQWRENRKIKEAASTSQQHVQNTIHGITTNNETLIINRLRRRVEQKLSKENLELQRKLNVLMSSFNNLQRKVQRQQVEIKGLNEKYENILKKLETNETKMKEVNENIISFEAITEVDETPNKKVTKYINQIIPNIETPKKEEIKKKLIEHDLLQESFKNEYKNSNMAGREVLRRVADSDHHHQPVAVHCWT